MVGYGLSEEFKVNIGLRQGNDPFTLYHGGGTNQQEVQQEGCSQEGMYANDLAMIADKKQELQEVLQEWKGVFKKEGPIMSRGEERRDVGLTSERGLEH